MPIFSSLPVPGSISRSNGDFISGLGKSARQCSSKVSAANHVNTWIVLNHFVVVWRRSSLQMLLIVPGIVCMLNLDPTLPIVIGIKSSVRVGHSLPITNRKLAYNIHVLHIEPKQCKVSYSNVDPYWNLRPMYISTFVSHK